MTTAHAIPDTFTVLFYTSVEGTDILETACEDYDAFKALPSALSFQGKVYGKTGWSSDTGRACFKTGTNLAYRV